MAQRGRKPKVTPEQEEKIMPEVQKVQAEVQEQEKIPVKPQVKILQAKPMRAMPTVSAPTQQMQSDNVYLVNKLTGKQLWITRAQALRQVKKYPATYTIK